MNLLKKTAIVVGLAATAFVSATPAMAQDYLRENDNTAAIAIGAGILGLAIGAIAASNNDHDRYYDRGYYTPKSPYRDGSYWNRDGRRYDRDSYQHFSRSQRDDIRRGYGRDLGNQRRGY